MIDRKTFKLSIVIPCYNEKNTIEKILKKIDLSLINYGFLNYEILVVDDFSNDGTKEVFVYLEGPGICGSGGCSTYILKKQSEYKWIVIGEYFPNYETSISSSQHEGFSIISYKGKFGQYECLFQTWEKNLYSCYKK